MYIHLAHLLYFLHVRIICCLLIYFVYLNLQKIAKKRSSKQVLIIVANRIFWYELDNFVF